MTLAGQAINVRTKTNALHNAGNFDLAPDFHMEAGLSQGTTFSRAVCSESTLRHRFQRLRTNSGIRPSQLERRFERRVARFFLTYGASWKPHPLNQRLSPVMPRGFAPLQP